ncbi:hypothetical protein DPEC_G00316870 [Dallia pectoralis]|uniref:Uncharacterized protein n=1 Tax=Dallia pectoralis TaxID=75939 RepID=A0ACC2FCP4_DALPE|nr:hypothetical protein DPEC_G00316870 [Dallia pectoralis]
MLNEDGWCLLERNPPTAARSWPHLRGCLSVTHAAQVHDGPSVVPLSTPPPQVIGNDFGCRVGAQTFTLTPLPKSRSSRFGLSPSRLRLINMSRDSASTWNTRDTPPKNIFAAINLRINRNK